MGERLTRPMVSALREACGVGLYHEFSNTSTVGALERRRLIQSDSPIGWYRATDAGRAALQGADNGR